MWGPTDLILVPGYLFDPWGPNWQWSWVLDRFLADPAQRWGVCFSHQITKERLAQEPTDVRMGAVCSELGFQPCVKHRKSVDEPMVILFFADIFGKPGRKAVAAALPDLKAKYSPDFIIGNAENLAGGRGINRRTFQEMIELGFNGFTSGNHVWDNREVLPILENDTRLIRPANYPSVPGVPCPGKGYGIFRSQDKELFVINVMGRVFMDSLDCPFQAADKILNENPTELPILVDMHAETTSEKYAMGWHLAGRVSAVVGSHTHVQTSDERILPGGTAYITDVGLTGSFDSVIGLKPPEIIRKFLTKRPHHYQTARENPGVCCVVIRVGEDRKAQSIERLRFSVGQLSLDAEGDLE